MPKNKEPIPKAPLSRILKKNGANRVTDEALISLSEKIEEIIKNISKKSIQFAKHAKRKTVLKKDMLFAIDETRERKK